MTPSTPKDPRLSELLRGARPAPALPPRFQAGVWRRIEAAEVQANPSATPFAWLDQWVERLLRPRFALASLCLLLLAGGLTGVIANAGSAKQVAQTRYLAAVAPNALH